MELQQNSVLNEEWQGFPLNRLWSGLSVPIADLGNVFSIWANQRTEGVAENDNAEWTRNLALLVDITEYLNVLNVTMQGPNKLVT